MQRSGNTSKTALVTGAARRVGKCIAETLAANGYAVAIHYRSSARDARKTVRFIASRGGRADSFRADLSRPAECRMLVDRVERRLGAIHLLVNSASVFYPTPFGSVTERRFDDILAANLKSVFFLSQETARRMRKRKSGVIVNIEDVATRRPYTGYAAYLMSKSGVAMLTKILAMELAPHVRVCGVAPGPVLLPKRFSRADRERAVRRTLLKREGAAEDVADAILFLADTARYTTGTTIFVDGGRAVL